MTRYGLDTKGQKWLARLVEAFDLTRFQAFLIIWAYSANFTYGSNDTDSIENRFPTVYKWLMSCYNWPSQMDIKLEIANVIIGGHGVEGTETPDGWITYVNLGDPYIKTILHFDGAYKLATWGDIAERYLD